MQQTKSPADTGPSTVCLGLHVIHSPAAALSVFVCVCVRPHVELDDKLAVLGVLPGRVVRVRQQQLVAQPGL